jgi:PAS domain S-box-containing protein
VRGGCVLASHRATLPIGRYLTSMAMACVAVILSSPAGVAQDGQKSVLTFYPTRRDAPAAAAQDRAFERILGDALPGRLDYYAEYIDLARFPEPDYQTAVRDFLYSKYRQRRFDLIIATTNATLEFVTRYRDDLFPGTPIVFSAGPGSRAGPNTAGIISQLNFSNTLDIATRLQPDTRRVVVVSGASAWDQYYETLARSQFKAYEGRLALTYLSGLPMPELLQQVANLPAHSIIYYLTVVEDGAGQRFTALDSLDKVAAVANAPIYAWHTVALNHGIVGGSLQSADVLAERIAEVAVRVLRGEQPGAIPVTEIDANVNEFDWRQLRRWRIDERLLPAGSIVRYRQPGVWERYQNFIVAAVFLLLFQTALIATLLFQRARRRGIEEALREHQQRYALATAAGAVGVWDWKLETNDIYIDPQLKRLLGFRDDEIRNHLDDWGQRVHPDDRDAVQARAQACIEGRVDVYEIEHRMLHKDGSLRWFLARGTLVRHADGTPYRMVGTDSDITERKRVQGAIHENEAALRARNEQIRNLAGRLIVAQEAERARIARDLHDDVSQQLAGLSIALSNLKRRVERLPDVPDALTVLQQRTIALAENIRSLSHDLHPSVLTHAGLVAALTAHCHEFQRQHGVEVIFQAADDFGSIGAEADLCLYRVAQEALRNTGRHAAARGATVRLARIGTSAELAITDDGKGFDITQASHHHDGLGLRSIHERVRLAGGDVSIVTAPGKGTAVQVRIPVEGHAGPEPSGAHEPRRKSLLKRRV